MNRYDTTTNTCGCPARKYNPTVPCKHMVELEKQARLAEEAERRAFSAFLDKLERLGTGWDSRHGVYTCGCDEWIDSRVGGIDAGGDCPHVAYLIKNEGE